jgi:Secretion system C-terminal sorting domain
MNKNLTTKTKLISMAKICVFSWLMLLTLLPLSIFAQNNNCGTSMEDLRDMGKQLLENRENKYLHTRGAIVYVPVCFHLVARTDGTGRVSESKVLDMLAGWNQLYTENNIDIQFYFKYFKYDLNDDNVYNTPRSTGPQNKMDVKRALDAMNIFCVGAANAPNQAGTTLAYYSRPDDWIVCTNSEITRSKSTIAHEAGHFFTLLHPFNGWDEDAFHPKGAAVCAPAISLGAAVATENVARTGVDANCSIAGDYMCDTPADYNFGYTEGLDWNNPTNSCVYNGTAKDPKCVAVDPDETLIMGYFIGCSDVGKGKFTGEQKTAIQKDYATNARRAYIRSGNILPNTQPIGLTKLILPADGAIAPVYNGINFDWADVPGAVGYIFEVSTSQTNFDIGRRFFLNSPISFATLNTSNIGTYLIPNKKYYWRVRAFGNYITGTDYTSNFTFTTGSINTVKEIEGIEGFTISPNPLGESRQINISLTSEKAFKAQVKIQNTAGQVMLRNVLNFEAGATNQMLDIKNLSSGMYILSIENEQGVLNKKIVVSN